jgi:hypothetical protein
MTRYYVFNGDADGLCALQQLRLVEPGDATLVTGVKRDIGLLERVNAAAADLVTVLDISLDRNRAALLRLLEAGAAVRYFDHHYAGELPEHPRFEPHIEETDDVCTSVLVDRYLDRRHRAWAIVAAFGDGLPKVATAMAGSEDFGTRTTATLEKLGISLNYNAYGDSVSDLHVDPAELAREMLPFEDPLDFVRHSPTFARLANELNRAHPDNAVAVLSPKARGAFVVSVRVPAGRSVSADEFCRGFDTGGGRKLAAGIDCLQDADLSSFVERFEARYRVRS